MMTAHEYTSRRINAALFGDGDQMFCARAYRRGWWPVVIGLDAWFSLRHGEGWHHCRRIALRDRLWRTPRPDDRFRLVDGT